MFNTTFDGVSRAGDRMVRVPINVRLVRHDHYVRNSRTGGEKLFRQSFSYEVVKEGVFMEGTAPEMPDMKKTWPADRSNPNIIVRRHVTDAKPMDPSERRERGRGRSQQSSVPTHFGDFDLRAAR